MLRWCIATTAGGRAIADSFKSHYSGKVSEVSLHPDKSTFADELAQISASGAPVLVLITFADMTDAVLDEVITHGHFDQVLLMNEHRSLALLAKYPEFLTVLGELPRMAGISRKLRVTGRLTTQRSTARCRMRHSCARHTMPRSRL